MSVCLLLEANHEVRLLPVSVLTEQQEPLHAIPEEERQVEQFPLLCGMYLFVVQLDRRQRSDGTDESEQADGKIVLAQQSFSDAIDLLHIT